MDPQISERLREELKGKPYEAKWPVLRHVIEHLFAVERKTVPQIVKILREQVGFYATEAQYKYHINRKWALKKRMLAREKDEMIASIQKTLLKGRLTAPGVYDPITTRKLIRHLRTSNSTQSLPIESSHALNRQVPAPKIGAPVAKLFMSWFTPWGPLGWAQRSANSPVFASQQDGWFTMPSPSGTPPPDTVPSPRQLPNSLVSAVQQKNAIDRARLFLSGNHSNFLRSMNITERHTMSTWMYQYWLHAYKTAKYWGRGPKEWTQDLIGHIDVPFLDSKGSPSSLGVDPLNPLQDNARNDEDCCPETYPKKIIFGMHANPNSRPSQLCFWSIHDRDLEWDDFTDEHEWTPEEMTAIGPFSKKLILNLRSNMFTNIPETSLPISISHILNESERLPEQFLIESVRIAIMSRSFPLIVDLLNQVLKSDLDITGIFPFHLAATYLDGATICCSVFDCLMYHTNGILLDSYVNDIGHTVLDILMITILRSHSACPPGKHHLGLRGQNRFPGEEIDICGRWDADSECIRALYATGKQSIPFEWKHKFCHTSALTICHSISTLFSCFSSFPANPNQPSGLFRSMCVHCGSRFELHPLHTLMLVALQLSLFGKDDEDLFGILACLLCLIANRSDASKTAEISESLFDDMSSESRCQHKPLSPAQLTEMIISRYSARWSRTLLVGWRICHWVLASAELEAILGPEESRILENAQPIGLGITSMMIDISLSDILEISSETSTVTPNYDDPIIPCSVLHSDDEIGFESLRWGHESNAFGMNRDLAELWAAVQTEMLTYRRQREHDPWISENFDMEALQQGLESGLGVCVKLVTENMMEEHCKCGKFFCESPICPTEFDVQAEFFSNIHTPRATYIDVPIWQDI